MKARIKKTGKIVNIYAECLAGFLADDGSYYEDDELSTELDDWSSFRGEAAKEILGAVIAKKSSMCSYGEVVEEAIKFADELIKQLKNESERIQLHQATEE